MYLTDTLEKLSELGVIPIINENDVVTGCSQLDVQQVRFCLCGTWAVIHCRGHQRRLLLCMLAPNTLLIRDEGDHLRDAWCRPESLQGLATDFDPRLRRCFRTMTSSLLS